MFLLLPRVYWKAEGYLMLSKLRQNMMRKGLASGGQQGWPTTSSLIGRYLHGTWSGLALCFTSFSFSICHSRVLMQDPFQLGCNMFAVHRFSSFKQGPGWVWLWLWLLL